MSMRRCSAWQGRCIWPLCGAGAAASREVPPGTGEWPSKHGAWAWASSVISVSIQPSTGSVALPNASAISDSLLSNATICWMDFFLVFLSSVFCSQHSFQWRHAVNLNGFVWSGNFWWEFWFAGTTIMAGGRPGSGTLTARNTSTWGRSVCVSFLVFHCILLVLIARNHIFLTRSLHTLYRITVTGSFIQQSYPSGLTSILHSDICISCCNVWSSWMIWFAFCSEIIFLQ